MTTKKKKTTRKKKGGDFGRTNNYKVNCEETETYYEDIYLKDPVTGEMVLHKNVKVTKYATINPNKSLSGRMPVKRSSSGINVEEF